MLLHGHCVCLVMGGKYEALLMPSLQLITVLLDILALKHLGLSVQGSSVSKSKKLASNI